MLGYIIGSRTPLRMFRRWLLGSMIRNMIILSGIAKEPNWMMSLPNQPRLVFLVVYPLVKYTKLCSLRLEFACRLLVERCFSEGSLPHIVQSTTRRINFPQDSYEIQQQILRYFVAANQPGLLHPPAFDCMDSGCHQLARVLLPPVQLNSLIL